MNNALTIYEHNTQIYIHDADTKKVNYRFSPAA